MKCEKCGYSLQIEDVVCPSCGTPNPFAREHREEMARYGEAFKSTQEAVLDRTRKTAGVMIKFIMSLVLLILSIIIILLSGSTAIRKNANVRKVQSNLDKYKAEYTELINEQDYIGLKEWFAVNHLNEVPQFKDCLNVYNVCENYEYLAAYLADIACEDYVKNEIEYGFRDPQNYCESIVQCYKMMKYYAEKETDDTNTEFNNACIEHTNILIEATFRLTDEDMEKFNSISEIEQTCMLMENWPYEK